MQNTAIEIWVYGVIMILPAGASWGFVKVGSKASLISGVGMGLALLASGYGVSRGSYDSLVVAEVIAALLLVLFAIRFAKNATDYACGHAGDSQSGGSGRFWSGLEEVTGGRFFR